MSDNELMKYKQKLADINAKMEQLEAEEPADENSKEYEAWCEKCESLALESENCMTMIDKIMAAGL